MLLANLLRTLSAEEINKVRKDFQLPERSRLIFERIASSPSSPPESEQLCKIFRISKENLYRLFSEIVEESVRILAPKEEFATLKFFNTKYLYRPFVTEAHRIEKRLIREKDKAALGRFYKLMFINLAAFPLHAVDPDLIEKFGMKWHRNKVNPPVDDDLYVRIRVIYIRIAALPSKKKMNLAQMSEYSRKLLDPISQSANSSPNPQVLHEYFKAEGKACVYQKADPGSQLKWAERSLEVFRAHRAAFDPDLEPILELQIAYDQATLFGKAKEGLETFIKHYRGQTPETSRGAIFLMRYIRVAFLAKDFQTAHQLLDQYIAHPVVIVTPTIFITALVIKALLELSEGTTADATETIEIAKSKNRENFFLAYEVQIRGLETANALKQGNFPLVDQLVERNIKWLRSRQISLSTSAWIYFYQTIAGIVRFKMTQQPIRPSLLDHFKKEFGGEHPEFFLMMQPEIQKH